ncbi:MAG: MFS transporter [Gammaproteobacteria bacterium]|nr:MFS transporter [Gammaproteobacteria bacterium]
MSSDKSQFYLFTQRRFWAYFLTQFLGAFNDNVYKNALIVLIAFVAAGSAESDSSTLVNLAAGLFILPFFLFSTLGGQLADKFEKSRLIRVIKLCEIVIMLAAVAAFVLGSLGLSIAVLFLMGSQSAFFGPVKYGILPQYLSRDELIGGNGLVEMGTFVAILIGTIVGSKVAAVPQTGITLICIIIVTLAVAGYLASRYLPPARATSPELQINWNPFGETLKILRMARQNRTVFLSILGISWFWFLGATYLAQFPNYTKHVLGGNVDVFTLLLTMFSIGIGVGSAFCERLSGHKIDIGLVPFGAIGLTVFGVDLFFATPATPWGSGIGFGDFFAQDNSLRLVVDILLIGIFGGFYIVPLYALVQQRTDEKNRSRIIAGNNVLNAIFMVLSAVLAIILLGAGMTIQTLFLLIALMNAVVALYIFSLVPEFLMRFVTWLLIHSIYRVKVKGMENIPEKGAVILACNHVSFVDPLIIGGSVRRPVRFVMDHQIYNIPFLNFIFRVAKTIPIAGKKEDPQMLAKAYKEMEKALDDGDILCIFPEGQITRDGELNSFRNGIRALVDNRPVPVVPMALQNLWGSMFSRLHTIRLPRKLFATVGLVIGKPIPANKLEVTELQNKVLTLRGDYR